MDVHQWLGGMMEAWGASSQQVFPLRVRSQVNTGGSCGLSAVDVERMSSRREKKSGPLK